MSSEAMKLAVDYLRLARDYGVALAFGNTSITDAINGLLLSIEAAEKMEPVAWGKLNEHNDWVFHQNPKSLLPHYQSGWRPLYLAHHTENQIRADVLEKAADEWTGVFAENIKDELRRMAKELRNE